MTWRELWKSTVTNLRALLGFSPQSSKSPARSSPPPLAPIVKRTAAVMPGPLKHSDRADLIHHAANHAANHTGNHTGADAPQTIDLTATRPLPHPTAPLRTRKPPLVPVDVALEAAAFAAMQRQRAEALPVVANPDLLMLPVAAPAIDGLDERGHGSQHQNPELTWTRQGVAQLEQPVMETPGEAGPFDPGDPSANGHGYGGNGYGDGGESDEDEGVALTTLLESLLFVAPEPVEPRQLAQTLDQPLEIIELGLAELADYYQRTLRGLRLQRFNDKVQLVTTPAAAPFIEAFLNLDNSTRLSSPALETLAVIAYRQPVTRAQIEAVRGVDCSGVLRSLMQRGLVAEVGRMEGIGRPILYGVTELFMQHFGLMEMNDLPPLEETEADRLWAATVIDEHELGGSHPDTPR
jgi:segregation and condensation protein B